MSDEADQGTPTPEPEQPPVDAVPSPQERQFGITVGGDLDKNLIHGVLCLPCRCGRFFRGYCETGLVSKPSRLERLKYSAPASSSA